MLLVLQYHDHAQLLRRGLANFFVAVLPTLLPEDHLDVCGLLTTLVLLLPLIAHSVLLPRRSLPQNYLDVFVSLVQLAVLIFGLPSVHGETIQSSLSLVCVLLIGSVSFLVFPLIAIRVYQVISKSVAHHIYLCHHSGVGGVACRVFHNILVKAADGSIFVAPFSSNDLGHHVIVSAISRSRATSSSRSCLLCCQRANLMYAVS